jgi:tetratricopeptide (TPR) repeat protein
MLWRRVRPLRRHWRRASVVLSLLPFALCPFSLPELPEVNTANFLPLIRAQIEQASAQARARPRDAKAVGALAMTLHAYQRYEAAAQAYSRASSLDPQNFDWLYLLGAVQMRQGAFDIATKSFQAALSIRQEDLPARLALAEALTNIAAWDEAGTVYRQILNQHHDLPQAWYGLGRTQSAQNDRHGALQSYARACELFPRYGAAQFALAGELRRLGKQAEAKRHLDIYSTNATVEPPLEDPLSQRVQEMNHSTQAHLQRGMELEKAGAFVEAIREHEAALTDDPDNVQVHVNLISLYGHTGDIPNAKLHFEAATRLSPGSSDAWYDYGILLFRESDYGAAEKAYRRAIDINPYYAEAHNNLGIVYERQNRLDDASKEFHKAIADRPDYPLARFHLGRILVNQQKYDEAIRHFLRALEPETDQTPSYLYALGATYARAGDRPHALEYLRKAHDAATAHGQPQLVTSIDRDREALERMP